ncbi:MAG: hypothetical protein JJ974_06955 [Phycisphaerales bacterium]|nr:hypothetical protein [Phycisphaerales bacterium]
MLICVLVCSQSLHAGLLRDEMRLEDQAEHWSIIDAFPADIDLVAVVDDPSEQLMSGAGRASRNMLGQIGMFSKTRRAWGALGELFETDADGVVDALMSGRVVLLVDGLIDDTSNPLSLMYAADTNWVVMGELDAGIFDQLRKKLKPVPREIVAGIPIYGIESGRYSMVMLKGSEDQKPRVMLSPKSGRALLERAMGAIQKEHTGPIGEHPVPRWSFDEQWGVALRVRVDPWVGMLGRFGWDGSSDQIEHLRCVIGASGDGFEVGAAIHYRGDVPSGSAPVGLLGALGDDTVIAMAASSIIRMDLAQEDGLSIVLGNEREDGLGAGGLDQPMNGLTRMMPSGSLFVFSTQDMSTMSDQDAVGMTVLGSFESGAIDAGRVDSIMESVVIDLPEDSSAHTRYAGLFPAAVRTCEIEDDDVSRVAWLTTERSNSSELIFSFSGDGVETGARVRKLAETSAAFDAIHEQNGGDPQSGSSVLLSGFVRVGALIESMSNTQWMGNVDLVSGLGLVNWEVLLDEGVLRARVVFR